MKHRSAVVAAVVLALAAMVLAFRFEVTTDIGEFLPTGADRDQARISQAVARGEATRTIMLTIEAADADAAVQVSKAFEEEARADAELMGALEFLEGGPPTGIDRGLWELYHPRRLSFVAATEGEAAHRMTAEGQAEAVADLKRRLASPLSTLVSQAAPDDPFLAIPRFFERMQSQRGASLASIDGRFIADERFAVFLVGTTASAFDAESQRAVLAGLASAHEAVAASSGAGPMESSGLARFSIRAEETIKADIQRTTIFSLLGLFALCLFVLRSFRLVAMTTVPIGCAMLCATAVSLLLYGRVHGLTFAFGASLIGVCVDYVVHFYVHHTMRPDARGARATLHRIWPALALGASTTAIGFAVIAGSSFPGLRQVAIFASVGIVAALLSTRIILPYLFGSGPVNSAVRDRLAAALMARFRRLRAAPKLSWALLAIAVGLTTVGAATVSWEEDLTEMGRLDPEMLAEDERVRERVARFDQGRFIIALASDEESALQINDKIGDALANASAAEELGGWHSVSTLLPSAARQEAVARTVRDQPNLATDFRTALADGGFNESLFDPFFESLGETSPEPLRFADLMASPAQALVRSLRLEIDGEVGFVSVVRDVHDPVALAERINAIEGARFIDQTALMSSAMHEYRNRTVQLLFIGLLAVTGILWFRYRSARVVAAVLAPAILAAGTTIFVLALSGRALSLVGLTAILMILSIGVDYGVFLAETERESDEALPATLLGLLVCWASTVLGFGILAISEHPTMNMIGIVAAVGVTASLILAPTTLALLPRAKDPA